MTRNTNSLTLDLKIRWYWSFIQEYFSKIYRCLFQFPAPEKRARFERTADILAKSGLLDITMKTADLIRKNQQAQSELVQLKAEIEQFTKSVLANPENQVN